MVTKILNSWVNTTRRWGIKQLGISFGSMFIVAGGNPLPLALNDSLDTIIIQFADQNQRLCCRLLPMMVNTLHLATTQRNVILPTVTLTGAIVSENGRNFKYISMFFFATLMKLTVKLNYLGSVALMLLLHVPKSKSSL